MCLGVAIICLYLIASSGRQFETVTDDGGMRVAVSLETSCTVNLLQKLLNNLKKAMKSGTRVRFCGIGRLQMDQADASLHFVIKGVLMGFHSPLTCVTKWKVRLTVTLFI